jgi:hypothetical protein
MQKPDIMNPKLSAIVYFNLLVSARIFFNKLLIKSNLPDLCKFLHVVMSCNSWTYRNSIPAKIPHISNRIITLYRCEDTQRLWTYAL